MRKDDVVFDEDQLIDGYRLQFVESVLTAKYIQRFGEKHVNGQALLEAKRSSMSRTVPVAEDKIDFFVLQLLLFLHPFLTEFLAQNPLFFLAVSVRQKTRVYV